MNLNFNIKQTLLTDYENIIKAKKLVKILDSNYISHKTFNSRRVIDGNTISIVMTTYNRVYQTYFTLQTIANSNYKNVQVILVDDHSQNLLSEAVLNEYGLHIDYIRIKNKFWMNPCVNYNIGFKFIKGSKIIIQNGEVCHIGDVIQYVYDNLKPNTYLSFDVLNLNSHKKNEMFHKIGSTNFEDVHILKSIKYLSRPTPWYQHHIIRNENLHFLTAISNTTLKNLGEFDYDYCVGSSYDDDAFVFQIKLKKIKIIVVKNDQAKVMGVHQWHEQTPAGPRNNIYNKLLFDSKKKYWNKTGIYIDLTQDDIPENIVKRIHMIFD